MEKTIYIEVPWGADAREIPLDRGWALEVLATICDALGYEYQPKQKPVDQMVDAAPAVMPV